MGGKRSSGLAVVLRDHYATEEADAGLRSSWGPMVEMASSGISRGGRSNYEGSITGHRFGFGRSDQRYGFTKEPHGSITEHRRVRSALAAMRARTAEWGSKEAPQYRECSADLLRDVLALAYGPCAWPSVIETTFKDAGEPQLVILTRVAERAYQWAVKKASEQDAERLALRGLGEWLRLPETRKKKPLLEAMCEEAKALLAAALEAFGEVYDVPAKPAPPARDRYVPPFYAERT